MTPAEAKNSAFENERIGKIVSMQTLIPISLLIGIGSAILFLGSALQRLDTAERNIVELKSSVRLMALHYISGFDEEVAHLNGNRSDNRVSNLMWCSKEVNESHKKIHGTLLFGEKAPWAKLTENEVALIRSLRKDSSLSSKRIGEIFGVSGAAILKILTGKTWAHTLNLTTP